MNDPYVRPDVRLFLDYYNKLPGPRAHEVGPNQARAMILASRQVQDLLGFASRREVDEFLKKAHASLHYSAKDLAQDLRTLRELGLR